MAVHVEECGICIEAIPKRLSSGSKSSHKPLSTRTHHQSHQQQRHQSLVVNEVIQVVPDDSIGESDVVLVKPDNVGGCSNNNGNNNIYTNNNNKTKTFDNISISSKRSIKSVSGNSNDAVKCTQCNAVFCRPCLLLWVKKNKSCPVCRVELTVYQVCYLERYYRQSGTTESSTVTSPVLSRSNSISSNTNSINLPHVRETSETIMCPYTGCREKLSIYAIRVHLDTCAFGITINKVKGLQSIIENKPTSILPSSIDDQILEETIVDIVPDATNANPDANTNIDANDLNANAFANDNESSIHNPTGSSDITNLDIGNEFTAQSSVADNVIYRSYAPPIPKPELPEEEKGLYTYHFVQMDDSLAGIATMYASAPGTLCRLNNLFSENNIYGRVWLKVPVPPDGTVVSTPKPTKEQLEIMRRRKNVICFMRSTSVRDKCVAEAYLNMHEHDLEAALQQYDEDNEWEQNQANNSNQIKFKNSYGSESPVSNHRDKSQRRSSVSSEASNSKPISKPILPSNGGYNYAVRNQIKRKNQAGKNSYSLW